MKTMILTIAAAGLVVSACGTTMTERAATGGLAGAAVGAAIDSSVMTNSSPGISSSPARTRPVRNRPSLPLGPARRADREVATHPGGCGPLRGA